MTPTETPPPEWIARNVEDVRARIARACSRSGRDPASVRLVAVTKSVPADVIPVLASLGVRDIAENRPLQLLDRRSAAAGVGPLTWHLIGHWQRNKVRKTVLSPDLFHAIDSIDLAQVVASEHERAAPGRPLPVLVQVNVSGEASKGGFEPADLPPALATLRALRGIAVRGLMTMAPESPDPESARPVFRRLRELRDAGLRSGYLEGPDLSMGMSEDFEPAVEEGSSMVRIGRRLFAPPSD